MSNINFKVEEISQKDIPINIELFKNKCKDGCRVYKTKWSCPPFSPSFEPKDKVKVCIVILWKENDIKAKNEFTKVKALNQILKSRLNKLLYQYSNNKVLGSGSCRLCQKCKYPQSCKYPNKRLYSCESVGIDVDSLCKLFRHELQWYKKGITKDYKYGSVVGIVNDTKENIIFRLGLILNEK